MRKILAVASPPHRVRRRRLAAAQETKVAIGMSGWTGSSR
jgi:hypothetical protein